MRPSVWPGAGLNKQSPDSPAPDLLIKKTTGGETHSSYRMQLSPSLGSFPSLSMDKVFFKCFQCYCSRGRYF